MDVTRVMDNKFEFDMSEFIVTFEILQSRYKFISVRGKQQIIKKKPLLKST